jgi:predicted ABC-type ATPase
MASWPVNLAYKGGAAKKKTSQPPQGLGPEPGLTKPPLWIGDPTNFCPTTTDKNIDMVFKLLTAGKKPAAANVPPHIVMTIGPPGAGKSTIARQFLMHWSDMKEDNYVELDADLILDYLPQGEQLRNLPDILGRPTGVGAAYGWDDCIGNVEGITSAIFFRLLEERYYIIYHSHYHMHLIEIGCAGYVSTLLYVAVSRETALRRVAARAKETGRFLRPAMESNGWGWENAVMRMWYTYRNWAPWYALWADNLGIVNNDRDGHEFVKEDFKSYLSHPTEPGVDWTQIVSGLWHAIGAVHGPEASKK